MTTIARRVIAEPVRLASETWKTILDLLAPESDNKARGELLAIIGIASSLIADETIKDSPIVVSGVGPRIRIYGLYGEDAIVGDDANESDLATSPLTGEWTMSLPCHQEDIEWIQSALKKWSTHVKARDMSLPLDDTETEASGKSASINLEAFLRP